VVKISELQFQHHPSNEYSGLISFRIDRFDLLGVQGKVGDGKVIRKEGRIPREKEGRGGTQA